MQIRHNGEAKSAYGDLSIVHNKVVSRDNWNFIPDSRRRNERPKNNDDLPRSFAVTTQLSPKRKAF
jgi:hypothetical protein